MLRFPSQVFSGVLLSPSKTETNKNEANDSGESLGLPLEFLSLICSADLHLRVNGTLKSRYILYTRLKHKKF